MFISGKSSPKKKSLKTTRYPAASYILHGKRPDRNEVTNLQRQVFKLEEDNATAKSQRIKIPPLLIETVPQRSYPSNPKELPPPPKTKSFAKNLDRVDISAGKSDSRTFPRNAARDQPSSHTSSYALDE